MFGRSQRNGVRRLAEQFTCTFSLNKSRLALLLLGLMGVLSAGALVAASSSKAVLGPTAGYFTETNGDIIEICADAACTVHTTTFNPGDTVFLKVTTTRVDNSLVSNSLGLKDYLNNNVGSAGSWTQAFIPPSTYVYSGQLTIPNPVPKGRYLKVVGKIQSITSPFPLVNFEEQLQILSLNEYMHFYSDAAETDESYTFKPGATIYVKAYGNAGTYSQARTGNNIRLYNFYSTTAAYNFTAPPAALVRRDAGGFWHFPITLPSSGLTDADWYWLQVFLRNTRGGTLVRMSEMIQIDATNPSASITSPTAGSFISGSIPVNGTADDTTSFYSYVLEYGAGAAPSSWTVIGAPVYTPVNSSLLETWDTTALADGLYTLRLTVTDRAYNTSIASVPVNVDNTPPVISGVGAINVHSTSATINWTTDEVSDSQVEYGINPGVYTWSTTLDPTLVINHNQAVTGLQPGTTYYYRVRSTDQAGNTAYSTEYSFTTANLTVLQPFPSVARDTNFGDSQPTWNRGAEIYLRAGDLSLPDFGIMRSTLRFDLSGIPATATINSATLSLYQMAQGNTSTPTLDVHYLTRDWTEGTGNGSATDDGATWLTYDGTNPWTSGGGDYNAVASASATAPDSTGSWVDWDVTNLTQTWINGAIPNYGMIIKQTTETPGNDDLKKFYSSDYTTDPALRPKLTVEWLGTDTSAPNIGEVRAEDITRTSANIKWSTDENSNSQVEYGTTTNYGSMTSLDPSYVNQHMVALTGLTEDTVYHYRVISTDPSGNQRVSGDYVFQTARVVTIQPDDIAGQDTWVSSSGQTLNYGAATELHVGENGAEALRGVLKFDLSSIPVGSTINSATLSLYQFAQADTSTPELGVYYATRGWTEGTGNGTETADGATWLTYDGASSWSSPGGDFDSTAQALATAPNTTGTWVDFAITSLTQSWLNGTIANNGVFVKKTTGSGSTDYKSFYSSDYTTDPTLRPKLVVEYVPAPGTITLWVNGTFNRDGSPGSGSVGFGSVNPGTTYYVGDGASPPYAVDLSVKSNSLWGLKVAATGDLVQANPTNFMDISNLAWKNDSDGPAAYQALVKLPAETIITSGRAPTNSTQFLFDFRLSVPVLAVSGTYSTSVVYTAYSE